MSLSRKRWIETAALVALLYASCFVARDAFSQDSQSKGTDRISGVVVNGATHDPIARALVTSLDGRFATMTNNDGRFEFTLPQAPPAQDATTGLIGAGSPRIADGNRGPYALVARKPGFLDDPNNPMQFVQRLPAGKDVTISLVPEALIVGHIALPTSEAPDAIEIELYRREMRSGRAHWVSEATQTTRANGGFRFSGLAAGTYKLLTHELMDQDPQSAAPGGQVYGYAPVYFPSAGDFASAATIQLAPGKTVDVNLSLVKQDYFPVRVPVLNAPPGSPLQIKVAVQGHDGPGFALGYDPREQVVEGLLPNGSYRLDAVGYGRNVVSGSTNIAVRGPLEGASLTVVPSSPISVHVKEEFTAREDAGAASATGAGRNVVVILPGRDVVVILEPTDDFGLQHGASSRPSGAQDASLLVENATPGRYWVRIQAGLGYASSVTSGGVDLERQPLLVPSAGAVPSIEVTLRDDGAQLEGTVEGATPSAGAFDPAATETSGQNAPPAVSPVVYCIPMPGSPGRFTEAYVSPDGKFTVPSVPPGEYRLLAFVRPQRDLAYENSEAMRAFDGKGTVIHLSGGQKEHVQLQLISSKE